MTSPSPDFSQVQAAVLAYAQQQSSMDNAALQANILDLQTQVQTSQAAAAQATVAQAAALAQVATLQTQLSALQQAYANYQALHPDLAGYTLAWRDDFATLNTANWNVRTGAEGGSRQGYDLAANVTVQSDGLHITAKRQSYGGKLYTSGYLDTIGKHSQSVARWEIVARLPIFTGAWPALWLRCDNSLGEIDIMEAVGGLPNTIVQTVHQSTNGDMDKSGYEWKLASFDPTQFHEFALERDADGSLRWYIDKTLTRSRKPTDTDNQGKPMTWLNGDTFSSPLNLRVNLQVGGAMPAYYNSNVSSSSVLPDDFIIRSVKVYNKI